MYRIPERDSRSLLSMIASALKALVAPLVRGAVYMVGLMWIIALIPFAVFTYFALAVLVGGLMAAIALYTRMTGRRIERLERILAFGRLAKMSRGQMVRRGLIDRE